MNVGPQTKQANILHQQKYRGECEDFREAMNRIASALEDNPEHFDAFRDTLLHMRFLPGGRIQRAVGAGRQVTPYNCFVSGKIKDSFVHGSGSIMQRLSEAAATMRMGGGIGYDFSTLRPRGDLIRKLGSHTDGPLAFLHLYDALCHAVSSAGHRRGAQMGVLRIDHPDIEEFIKSKQVPDKLARLWDLISGIDDDEERAVLSGELQNAFPFRGFNLSVAVTDKFMEALYKGGSFPLKFNNKVYKTVEAAHLWDSLMRSTWDWAEPGVIFIDRINEMNNLWYCETIAATNPCQPKWATVLTPEGISTIDKIEIGDSIWSGTQWTQVINKTRTGIKPVYAYRTRAGTFYGTENHRVLSDGSKIEVDKAKTIDAKQGPKYTLKFVEPSILDPQDVMDGLVLGDGTTHKASNSLTVLLIGKNDSSYFESEIKGLIKRHRPSLRGWEIVTSITDPLPKTYNREVPKRFRFGTGYKVRGFLRGLYSANGSVAGGRVTLKAASFKVIEAVQEMLSYLGIASYYTVNKPQYVGFANGTYKCKESYDLNIGTVEGRKLFAEWIGFIQPYKTQRLNESLLKKSRKNRSKISFEVLSKTLISEEEVYSLTVDCHEHTYWTGGLHVGNCGEQPLAPHSACLLGSFNLVKYLDKYSDGHYEFDWVQFKTDIPHVVRAMDNIIDQASYPLEEQETEARSKRRMGLGLTSLANTGEALGFLYGSEKFLEFENRVMVFLRDNAYLASIDLAKEKGSFQKFDAEKYLEGKFIKTLPIEIQEQIRKYGIRNSHLLSIAPTGTISMCADNVSSSIEPVFSYDIQRTLITKDGPEQVNLYDYGYKFLDVKGKLCNDVTIDEHLSVLTTATKYVDSAVSKTCNVGANVSWFEFKDVYQRAWANGAKGCTTFRLNGKRFGILKTNTEPQTEAEFCKIDLATGRRNCE